MVLKNLFTPKPLLVEYVLSSIVSFITNITLVWFLLFSIASNFSRFHTEASHLKDILSLIKLVDNYTPVALTVEKKELLIVVPYLGNLPLTLRTCLQNGINKNLPYWKIRVIFKSTSRLSNFFSFKVKEPFNVTSNVVYKFSGGRFNTTYYGKTWRHLNVRVCEHSDVSLLTGTRLKSKTTTALKDHMLICDHVVSLEDFKILTGSNLEFYLKVKESLLISRHKPELNKNDLMNVFPNEYFICTRFYYNNDCFIVSL